MFIEGELEFLWPFYLEKLISKLVYILPSFMIVYFTKLGLSVFQIGLLIAIWPLAALLCEVPTGALADIYGRKYSVLLGRLFQFAIMLLLFVSESYIILISLMAMLGVASTLITGADEAWVVDLIKKKNGNLLSGYFAKAASLTCLGFVISGLIGAYFVNMFGIRIIWIVTSLSFLTSIVILLFAEEDSVKTIPRKKKLLRKYIGQIQLSTRYSLRHKNLFYLLIAGAIIAFASSFFTLITWTPFMRELGYPDYAFGYMISAISLVGILALLLSERICRKIKKKKVIVFSLVGLIASLSAILLVGNTVTAFVVLLAGTFFSYIISTNSKVYFHNYVPSRLRATIGSIHAMLLSFVGLVAFPIAGLLVDWIGARYTLFISGGFFIPSLIIYHRIISR